MLVSEMAHIACIGEALPPSIDVMGGVLAQLGAYAAARVAKSKSSR
jgi:hypothetical protein